MDCHFDETGQLSKYSLLRELLRTEGGSVSARGGLQDEIDPLGGPESILEALRAQNINVDADLSLKSKYLISSTKFSPMTFLRDVHSSDSYEELASSLDYLESTIAKRSEALRSLVDLEYDRFVKSKSLLDAVLSQIESAGFNESQDWGMAQVKTHIDEANSKSTVAMKPVIEHRAKDEELRSALDLIEANKTMFNLPSTIQRHVDSDNHDAIVKEYRRGKDALDFVAATHSSNNRSGSTGSHRSSVFGMNLSDATDQVQRNTSRLVERVMVEVEAIVEQYRNSLWKKLSNPNVETRVHMAAISKLLDLGVPQNPILKWMEEQVKHLNGPLTLARFENLKVRTNLMRMNIMTAIPPAEISFVLPLREYAMHIANNSNPNSSSGELTTSSPPTLLDAMEVVEMWLMLKLISENIGALATRIYLFWQTCSEFITGQRQSTLPRGYNDESAHYLQFSQSEVSMIKTEATTLISMFVAEITDYFSSPAPRIAMTGIANAPGMPASGIPSPRSPASPSAAAMAANENETFLFLPPYSNALSAANYLAQVVPCLQAAYVELHKIDSNNVTRKKIATSITTVRTRCACAVFRAWDSDAKRFGLVEDWSKFSKDDQITKVPMTLYAYNCAILDGLGRILNPESSSPVSPEATSDIITQALRQFHSSLLTSITSLTSLMTTTVSSSSASADDIDELAPHQLSYDTKLLLTLSNVRKVRNTQVPQLLKLFQRLFGMSVRETGAVITRELDSIIDNLFEMYSLKKRSVLTEIVDKHWSSNTQRHPQSGSRVSNYILEALLALVLVHSQVHVVSEDLTRRVIAALFEHLLSSIEAHVGKQQQTPELALQCFIDVKFARMILDNYRTAHAEELYSILKGQLEPLFRQTSSDAERAIFDAIDSQSKKTRFEFLCFQR